MARKCITKVFKVIQIGGVLVGLVGICGMSVIYWTKSNVNAQQFLFLFIIGFLLDILGNFLSKKFTENDTNNIYDRK